MRCGWKSMRLNNEYLSQWVGKTASNTTWITRKCSVDSRKIYEWKKMRKNIMNAGDGFLTWLFMNAQACAYKGHRFALFVPIWSVGFEAIVFKIKTNQKGLSFFYSEILKKHVEMVWFGLFSLWNRTALLLFILIFCGLKSITKCTEKMRLGNCKRYKRFRRRAGILIKLNTQNHFFGVMKYQLPWSASKEEKNLLDEKITRHDEY